MGMRRRWFELSLAVVLCLLSLSITVAGAPAHPDAITIASWNLLNLGATTPVEQRAKVIAQFDIVSVQEVESLEGLERLRAAVEKASGTTWKAVVSPKLGSGQAAEYYAFLYRANRVRQIGGASGVYHPTGAVGFSRPPFFGTFRAGQFDFTLITVHITFATPESLRTEEVKRLAKVWQYVQEQEPEEHDLLLMGDFNRNRPTHAAFTPLRDSLGLTYLITGDETTFTTYGTSANKIGGAWYDDIWMDADHTSNEYTGKSGIYYTYQRFYTSEASPHLLVRTKISDHCPVWAEFSTAGPDDD